MKNYVKALRLKQGITQQELAKAVEVSRQTIITVEKNECVPSLKLAMDLAKYFKIPVEQIFC